MVQSHQTTSTTPSPTLIANIGRKGLPMYSSSYRGWHHVKSSFANLLAPFTGTERFLHTIYALDTAFPQADRLGE